MAAVINIALNLILIPPYGIIGAAVATVLTEIIFTAIYCSFIIRYGFNFKFLTKFIHKLIIAGGVMIFAVSYVGNLFLAVFVGAVIYSAILFLFGIMDMEDKVLLVKIKNNL